MAEKTLIIGISGKKQAGKSTLVRYLTNVLAYPNETIYQDEKGIIHHSSIEESPIANNSVAKTYAFADKLKEFCVECLGLTYEQVNGSDEQKNSLTKFKWENLPYIVRWNNRKVKGVFPAYNEEHFWRLLFKCDINYSDLRTGFMTAREILQIFGTDIMRKMFDDAIWVNATIKKIKQEQPQVAFIEDVRFPSELESIYNAGGYIIRLHRSPFSDGHSSEIAFDDYDWDNLLLRDQGRVLVIQNNCTLAEKNETVKDWLFKQTREFVNDEQSAVVDQIST